MQLRKILPYVVLSATAIASAACYTGNNPEYHWKGKIRNDEVRFYEGDFDRSNGYGGDNFIEVKKPDGTRILYADSRGDDLKIDYVEITVGNNTTKYSINSVNSAAVAVAERAQQEFDYYLNKITEIQTASLGTPVEQ